MKKNYLKVAFRNFRRYSWNSIFNILGLSLGIACSLYILTLLRYELGYDRFHDDIELVYRICQKSTSRGETTTFACTVQKYSDYILENYDGIEYMARYAPNRPATVSYEDRSFIEERHIFVEADIFNIIKTSFIYGNRETCLERPNTVVISERVYNKYFKNRNPLGALINIDTIPYEVTGVIRNLPENSRFQHDFYESWITYENQPGPEGWNRAGRYLMTFIKFKSEANIEAFSVWIKDIPEHINRNDAGYYGGEQEIFIQPLKGLHLAQENNTMVWDWENAANPVYIYILIGTVILILIMSGLNYINLNIASYSIRAKEVSTRKTLGATRRQLVYQFIGESILLVFISHIIGVFLIEMLLPMLNNMTGFNLVLDYSSAGLWLMIIAIILILGLGAGSYPAFYLSLLSPAKTEKSNIFGSYGRFDFKEVLIVIQFALSIILIIGTLLIYRQVNYMKNMDMGIAIKDKLIVELPRGMVNSDNRDMIKEEFINAGLFTGASISSSVPGRSTYTWRLWPTGEQRENSHPINCIEVDHDYIDLYGLELVAGNKFDKNLGDESNLGYIQNEVAIRVFGWGTPEEAMTKSINDGDMMHGILKDFHYEGLQKEIEPFGMFYGDADDSRYLTLQYETAGMDNRRLDIVKDKFNELFPDKIFRYFFLEQDFNLQYKSEDRLIKLFVAFTLVAILIAVIGLFGMTAFYCVQKEKSMGIRKVFGAEPSVILTFLVKRFSTWVALSFIIAVPLSVIGIRIWLSNFAYRTHISIAVIIAAGLVSMIITLLTVMFHSVRLSRKNPVDVIRIE